MVKASSAQVFWDAQKKAWIVRIQAGEEAVRRPCKGGKRDLEDDALRALAIQTAHDDGYELPVEAVTIQRQT